MTRKQMLAKPPHLKRTKIIQSLDWRKSFLEEARPKVMEAPLAIRRQH